MPPRPPSEETVEAALSAYHEESERLRELPGEDEDDDMGDEEVEELFGRGSGGGAGDPINVEGGDGAEDEGGEQDENADDQVSRPCTSDVWLDFKKLFKMGPKAGQLGA
ncbi:unnamed protein product [Miscanthus lutarioriparius]|uniref:Uncharacterized protein n=1 Tax=Miscanthus lutarioriparius TaxID=422564 RepID=A0A811QGN5_9POAL|nr:unnamed protein product [Miscanthus lutarioriparius]